MPMIRGRKVGPVLATMLVASNMVGSGIFLLPATLATVGGITILGWIVAAGGALLVATVLAKLGHVAPRAGGPCVYAGDGLGPYFGMQASVIYWISCWVGNIAIAIAAISYLASFFPALAAPLHGVIATTGLIWLLTLLNIFGPRLVCAVESAALIFGAIPLLVTATLGWAYFDIDVFRASWNVSGRPAIEAVPASLLLVFWAFLGLESASIAAAVVEKPSRNVPIATVGGVLLAALIYTTSCSAVMGLLPASELAASNAPFADAMRIVLGTTGGALIAVMALVKVTGTLAGWILVTAQTGKTAAERGILPVSFTRVDRYGIPVANLLIMAMLMTVVIFATMSPTLGEQFATLIEVSVVLTMLLYVYACTAVWRYDRLVPSSGLARYKLIAAAAMLFCAFVIAQLDARLLLIASGIVIFTIPLYFVVRRSSRYAVARSSAGVSSS